jgi:hypothetical protein
MDILDRGHADLTKIRLETGRTVTCHVKCTLPRVRRNESQNTEVECHDSNMDECPLATESPHLNFTVGVNATAK